MGLSFPFVPKSIGRGPSAKTSPTSEALSTSSKLCPTFSSPEDRRRSRDAGRLTSLSCGIRLGVSSILGSIDGTSFHLQLPRLKTVKYPSRECNLRERSSAKRGAIGTGVGADQWEQRWRIRQRSRGSIYNYIAVVGASPAGTVPHSPGAGSPQKYDASFSLKVSYWLVECRPRPAAALLSADSEKKVLGIWLQSRRGKNPNFLFLWNTAANFR
jgi:hypothetical protein